MLRDPAFRMRGSRRRCHASTLMARSLQRNETVAGCHGHRLEFRVCAEFGKDVADVISYGMCRDEELGCYGGRRSSIGKQSQYADLPGGQILSPVTGLVTELSEQVGEARLLASRTAPSMPARTGTHNFDPGAVLGEKANTSGCKGASKDIRRFASRHHEDLCLGPALENLLGSRPLRRRPATDSPSARHAVDCARPTPALQLRSRQFRPVQCPPRPRGCGKGPQILRGGRRRLLPDLLSLTAFGPWVSTMAKLAPGKVGRVTVGGPSITMKSRRTCTLHHRASSFPLGSRHWNNTRPNLAGRCKPNSPSGPVRSEPTAL